MAPPHHSQTVHALVMGGLLAIAPLALGAAENEPVKPEPPDTITALVEQITQILQDTRTPGMSLAVVTRDEVLYTGGLGFANVAEKTPATADTLFRIGSTSKALTAFAALKLQAEGRLDLDATFASLAPEIAIENPWEASDPVRIVHLLTHTAGLDDIHLRDYANADPRPHNLRDALDHTPTWRVVRWRPGTRFAYCNGGPALVAYVIEKITGEAFEDYVQREFFTPIGMTTATYFPPADESVLTRLYAGDGVTPHAYWYISMRPAGSINASANDMAAYVRFYLNRGWVGATSVLSEEAITRMEQPGPTSGTRAGLTVGYGFYNYTSFDNDGRVWHGHGGGVQGGRCDMSYLPEAGVGYSFTINSGNGRALGKTAGLLRTFLTRDLPKPEMPPSVAVTEEIAASYTGFYIPVSPRTALAAPAERFAGVRRLSFADDKATFGSIFGQKTELVGVSPTLLRRKKHTAATVALSVPTETDAASVVDTMTSFRRVPAIVALGPLAVTAATGLMAASTILFLPVWLLRGLRRKIRLRDHLGLRLWPLAASLLTAWFFVAIGAIVGDDQIFQHYGNVTVRSVHLAVAGVAAMLAAIGGLIAVTRRKHRTAHRGLRWHALLTLTFLTVLSLALVYQGVIPFVSWN